MSLGGDVLDSDNVRLRIRHFLLQKSILYTRAVSRNADSIPPVLSMAQELAKKLNLTTRRLQKYLSKELPPKELSITLSDLHEFSILKGTTLGNFVAYILEEKSVDGLSSSYSKIIDGFANLHEAHRRSLAATVFSGKDRVRSEEVIDICLKSYPLDEEDRRTVFKVIEAFHERSQQREK